MFYSKLVIDLKLEVGVLLLHREHIFRTIWKMSFHVAGHMRLHTQFLVSNRILSNKWYFPPGQRFLCNNPILVFFLFRSVWANVHESSANAV